MYEYKVSRLYEVVDGDTIEVDIDLGFDIAIHKRVRLAGIDTPESRTKDAYEKKLGLESKEWLKQKLKDAETLRIKTEKPDSTEKYGRILGWLYIGNEATSINETMIQQGYAWSYLGEKKVKDFALLEQRRKANAAPTT
jgi:micrococcal nuclease